MQHGAPRGPAPHAPHTRSKLVDSPNFKEAPFHLTAEGIYGSTRLADVGGAYPVPIVQRDKVRACLYFNFLVFVFFLFAHGMVSNPN